MNLEFLVRTAPIHDGGFAKLDIPGHLHWQVVKTRVLADVHGVHRTLEVTLMRDATPFIMAEERPEDVSVEEIDS